MGRATGPGTARKGARLATRLACPRRAAVTVSSRGNVRAGLIMVAAIPLLTCEYGITHRGFRQNTNED